MSANASIFSPLEVIPPCADPPLGEWSPSVNDFFFDMVAALDDSPEIHKGCVEDAIKYLSGEKGNAKWLYDLLIKTTTNLEVQYGFGTFGENNPSSSSSSPIPPNSPKKKRRRGEDEEDGGEEEGEGRLTKLLKDKSWEPLILFINQKNELLYGTTTKASDKVQKMEEGRYFRRHFSTLITLFHQLTNTNNKEEEEDSENLLKIEIERWRTSIHPIVRLCTQPPQLNWTLKGWGEPELAFAEFMRKTNFSDLAISDLQYKLRLVNNSEKVMGLIKEEAKFFKGGQSS
jgi:hypothetical protein